MIDGGDWEARRKKIKRTIKGALKSRLLSRAAGPPHVRGIP